MIAAALETQLPPVVDTGPFFRRLATLTLPEFTSVIHATDTEAQRRAVSTLINDRYAWRGYNTGVTIEECSGQMTLFATDYPRGVPIGTLTIRLDRPGGLLADGLYPVEVQRLRAEGRRLCEIVRFAVEGSVTCKHLLAALFHVAFIFAHRLNQCSDLLIEVNPRHVSFYCRLLRFQAYGAERINPRVNARSVLLRLDLRYAGEQIRRFGGQRGSSSQRSLYPYAFSPIEEGSIWTRMRLNAAMRVGATSRGSKQANARRGGGYASGPQVAAELGTRATLAGTSPRRLSGVVRQPRFFAANSQLTRS